MKLFASPGRARRARWAAVVIATVLVAGAMLIAWRLPVMAADAAPPVARGAGDPPVAAGDGASGSWTMTVVPPTGNTSSPGRRQPGPGELEVCDGEPVTPDMLAGLSTKRLVAAHAQATRLIEPMRFHPDPAVRAAGLLLADSAARLASFAEVDASAPRCADDACLATAWQQASQRHRQQTQQGLAALVELALGSRDLPTYALAAQWCASAGQELAACRQVSLAEWARRDPDNMAAWLRLAQQADLHKDAEARDEALFRAAAATRHDTRHQAVVQAALTALPQGTDALVQQQLLGLALDVRNSTLAPVFNLTAACKPAQLGDTNRWQRCDGLADALTRRGSTMLELRLGLQIGRAVGWPADRVAALEQEAEAMVEAQVRTLGTQPGLSCPEIQVFRQFVAETGDLGELAAARAMIDRTGRTPAFLAAAHRERMAALQASATAAAAATAAASAASRGGP